MAVEHAHGLYWRVVVLSGHLPSSLVGRSQRTMIRSRRLGPDEYEIDMDELGGAEADGDLVIVDEPPPRRRQNGPKVGPSGNFPADRLVPLIMVLRDAPLIDIDEHSSEEQVTGLGPDLDTARKALRDARRAAQPDHRPKYRAVNRSTHETAWLTADERDAFVRAGARIAPDAP